MNLFDIPNLKNKLKMLENQTLKTDFWDDMNKANKVLQEFKSLKNKIDTYLKVESELNDLIGLNHLSLFQLLNMYLFYFLSF